MLNEYFDWIDEQQQESERIRKLSTKKKIDLLAEDYIERKLDAKQEKRIKEQKKKTLKAIGISILQCFFYFTLVAMLIIGIVGEILGWVSQKGGGIAMAVISGVLLIGLTFAYLYCLNSEN